MERNTRLQPGHGHAADVEAIARMKEDFRPRCTCGLGLRVQEGWNKGWEVGRLCLSFPLYQMVLRIGSILDVGVASMNPPRDCATLPGPDIVAILGSCGLYKSILEKKNGNYASVFWFRFQPAPLLSSLSICHSWHCRSFCSNPVVATCMVPMLTTYLLHKPVSQATLRT